MLQHPRAADKIDCVSLLVKGISQAAHERSRLAAMLAKALHVLMQAARACDQAVELLHHTPTSTAQV